MAGVKGAKLAARAGKEGPRKHYCPTCIGDADEITSEMEAKPVMVFPKSRMFFKCRAEHMWKRGQTILV
jgi:hypothetical protein